MSSGSSPHREHKQVAMLTPEQWAREGVERLESLAAGKTWVPKRNPVNGRLESPGESRKLLRDRLERGRDATLQVDDWTRWVAREEAEQGGLMGEALDAHHVEQWPDFVRETFARLYAEPGAVDPKAKGSEWIQALHDKADETDAWDALRRRCRGNPWAAGVATARTVQRLKDDQSLLRQIPVEDAQRLQDESDTLAELGVGENPSQELSDDTWDAACKFAANLSDDAAGGERVRAMMRQAAQDALGEIEAVEMGVGALAGTGTGMLSKVACPPHELRKALSANPSLRRIAEMAGRLRIAARSKQRIKSQYVPEQVVDVTLGGELSRLVPSELAQLADSETELLVLRRMLERQALEYRLEGNEALDRGPIVLMVDGSGSMKGPRHEWAMAVALALVEICAIQRRGFCLVHFDSVVKKAFEVPASGRIELAQLIEMVSFFSGGGTNFEPPLTWAASKIATEEWKRADAILVTDGQGSWGISAMQLRELGAAVYGIGIGAEFTEAQREQLTGVAVVRGNPDGDTTVDLVFGL